MKTHINIRITMLLAMLLSSVSNSGELTEIDRKSWISDVYEHRSDGVILRDMTFPGTHDSGTYNITPSSDLHSSQSVFYNLAKGVVSNWSKTVNDNCYDQLNSGIRYLDLRIREHNGGLFLIHALVGMKFEDCLSQVQKFMNENPREIVFLEAANIPDEYAYKVRMYDLFDQYLKNRKPDNSKVVSQLSLADLWAADPVDGVSNTAIIMINGDESQAKARGFFNNDDLSGGYANTTSVSSMLSHLEGLLADNSDNQKMKYITYTLTPQTQDIINDVVDIIDSDRLEDWSDLKLRPIIGEHSDKVEENYTKPNFIATDFHEYTSAVASAIRFNTVAPPAPQSKLEIALSSRNERIWDDAGSGGSNSVSLWRPVTVKGYRPLYYSAIASQGTDNRQHYLVKLNQPGVVKPLGYTWLWNDRGTGADRYASIYRPIPPKGYVCLGDVAVPHNGLEPSTDLIRCVHESYTTESSDNRWVYNDVGAGGTFDVVINEPTDDSGDVINVKGMRANRNHAYAAKLKFFRHLVASKAQVNALPVAKLSDFKPGSEYGIYIRTMNGCELQWQGGYTGSAERNAKFDCLSTGDRMIFEPDSQAIVAENGTVSVHGVIRTVAFGYQCGLEWDSGLSDGERNAKFDCSGSADPLTIISRAGDSLNSVIIKVDAGCGLQWDSSIDSYNERNAKFDCEPAYDEFTLYGE